MARRLENHSPHRTRLIVSAAINVFIYSLKMYMSGI